MNRTLVRGRLWPLVLAVAIIGLLPAGGEAATSPYTAVDLGTLGGASSSAAAINNAGLVVGSSVGVDGYSHAFLWVPPALMLDLGTLGGGSSSATDINNVNQVVGTAATASGSQHAFVWTAADGMVDLGTLGGNISAAAEINDAGEVVGSAQTASGQTHAFIWTQAGGMLDLGALGSISYSQATGINADGTVVGIWAYSPIGLNAFVWTRTGGIVDFNLGTETRARAVNNAGQIGGDWVVPTPTGGTTFHAFLWTQGIGAVDVGTIGRSYSYGMDLSESGQLVGLFRVDAPGVVEHAYSWTQAGGAIDLGTLGGSSSSAWGVNSAGEVVGAAYTSDGVAHATLWQLPDSTPPAAPSTPDLAAFFDSGRSGSDNITMRRQLLFEGTAENGSTVTLYRGDAVAKTGIASAYSGHWMIADTVPADGIYTYTATATDAAGNTSLASAALVVTVDTHAPVLSADGLSADATGPNGATVGYTVPATDAGDPSVAADCSPGPGSHFEIGDTSVSCSATDTAGNVGTASYVVHVRGAAEQISALLDLVLATDAKPGIPSSLNAKLSGIRQALAAANADNRADAVNKLGAFINDVNAQSGKALTTEQASQLINAAKQIQAVLG